MHRTGFGEPPCRHDAGGLLPHRFTLTDGISGDHAAGGLFSVPLSVGFRRLPRGSVLPCGVRTFLEPEGPRSPGLRAEFYLDDDRVEAPAQDARNGEIVVALAGDDESADEATVKTFYRDRGRVRLQPENSALEPIYADHVSILGKVVGVFREL